MIVLIAASKSTNKWNIIAPASTVRDSCSLGELSFWALTAGSEVSWEYQPVDKDIIVDGSQLNLICAAANRMAEVMLVRKGGPMRTYQLPSKATYVVVETVDNIQL